MGGAGRTCVRSEDVSESHTPASGDAGADPAAAHREFSAPAPRFGAAAVKPWARSRIRPAVQEDE
ncbi:hypothetical protein GCM10010129_07580 [Streptomyces fumigatiscleroticus]|nr:hypothetical protein GCM10010129_07580 [Streptomyces fumigatiscleroticus]